MKMDDTSDSAVARDRLEVEERAARGGKAVLRISPGARVFATPEDAKNYFRRQGVPEEEIAKLTFIPAGGLPLSVRDRMVLDESMRMSPNQRRRLRRAARRAG